MCIQSRTPGKSNILVYREPSCKLDLRPMLNYEVDDKTSHNNIELEEGCTKNSVIFSAQKGYLIS